MNKFRGVLALLILFLGSGLAWASVAHAQVFSSTTSASQTVNSSLYSYGQTVDIEGTINGDVYCAGQNVTIDATVHGDVLCAGQAVTVSGHIDGSLRVVAQDITDQATVGRSFSAVAHYAVITENATVGVDAAFAGQTFSMNGHVGRDIAAQATTMNINGTVGRNVKYTGTNLNIWSKAHVRGMLNYTSGQPAMIAKSAVIRGAVSQSMSMAKTQTTRAAFSAWAGTFVYVFIGMLLFGLILVLLVPQTVRAVSEEAVDHLPRALLNALVLLILEPIVVIVLFGIVFGIPLALACILLFMLFAILSLPVTAYFIGTHLMSRSEHAVLAMTVGMFILVLLLLLPVVGFFAIIASYFIGTGAIILALRKYLPSPVYKVK